LAEISQEVTEPFYNLFSVRCLLWVRLGHSAMSAQCPVCPKPDKAGRFMSTRPNLMTQHAQIAERKYCRPHARPFRLRFARVVAVFPVCSPATSPRRRSLIYEYTRTFAPLSASPHVQQHYGCADAPVIAAVRLVAAPPRPVTQPDADRTADHRRLAAPAPCRPGPRACRQDGTGAS
jgi:hypothetical protein